MHRPRGGAAVLSSPDRQPAAHPEQEPLPQAWVPRVLNAMLALVFLAILAPITTTLGDRPGYEQAGIVLFALPFLLLAGLCLASAIRPGSLGRALRRARARRKS